MLTRNSSGRLIKDDKFALVYIINSYFQSKKKALNPPLTNLLAAFYLSTPGSSVSSLDIHLGQPMDDLCVWGEKRLFVFLFIDSFF